MKKEYLSAYLTKIRQHSLQDMNADNFAKMETNRLMKEEVEELKDVLVECDEHQYDYIRELEMKARLNAIRGVKI